MDRIYRYEVDLHGIGFEGVTPVYEVEVWGYGVGGSVGDPIYVGAVAGIDAVDGWLNRHGCDRLSRWGGVTRNGYMTADVGIAMRDYNYE